MLIFSQVALVKWTESVGLPLVHRDLTTLTLRTTSGKLLTYTVLQIFPFTSETKRMGIIVRVYNGLINFQFVRTGGNMLMS